MTESMDRKGAARRRGLLLVLMAVTFAVVFLFPMPRHRVGSVALAAIRSPEAELAVVGNSVVAHVSKCDRDRRDIPAMLQDESGVRVEDLSYGGQSLAESINFAALALKQAQIRTVVLFLGGGSLASPDPNDLQTTLFFRLTAGDFGANDLRARFERGVGVSPSVPLGRLPFRYKGVDYPGYEDIQMTYFADEKARQSCPETLGHNRRFIEANFWTSLVRPPPHWGFLGDLGELQRRAAAQDKRVIVVLLPNDEAAMQSLDQGIADEVRRRRTLILRRAAALGVSITEISPLQPDHFADRWCACGHLSERGRQAVTAVTRDLVAN